MRLVRFCFMVVFSFFVFGCSNTSVYLAPVKEIGDTHDFNKDTYIVTKGDTLYSIAWMIGSDYRELARWNNLTVPYKLSVGQVVYLTSGASHHSFHPGKGRGQRGTVENHTRGVLPHKPKHDAAHSGRVESRRQSILPQGSWVWPAKGKVTSVTPTKFYYRNGIDIKGQYDSPIVAAGPGTVVYSGSGVRGYGNLILIEHTPSLLSAYAHNSQILVKEGDHVKVGQSIARMGKNENGKPLLYFEIRKSGKSVSPLAYLTKQHF
jgi:lipoprotein NlpD